MSPELQINISEEQANVPVSVIKLVGEVTSDNFEELTNKAKAAYETGMRHCLIDFSETTYMSSAGLRAVHAIYLMLQGDDPEPEGEFKSDKIKLLNVPEKIFRLVRVTGFDRYMAIFSDYAEAIASF